MVLEKTNSCQHGEKRKKMGFPDFFLKVVTFREWKLVLWCLRKGTPGLATYSQGKGEMQPEQLISSWESTQTNESFLGNVWALGLGMRSPSLSRKTGQKACLLGNEMGWCLLGQTWEKNVSALDDLLNTIKDCLVAKMVPVLSLLWDSLASFRLKLQGMSWYSPLWQKRLHTNEGPCEDGCSHLQTCPCHPPYTCA